MPSASGPGQSYLCSSTKIFQSLFFSIRSGYCGLKLSSEVGDFIVNSNSVGNLVIEGEGEICHKKRSNGSFFIDTNTSRDFIQVMMTAGHDIVKGDLLGAQ